MEQQPRTLILCYMLDFMRIMELGGPLTCPGQSALSMADEGDGFDLRLRGELKESNEKSSEVSFVCFKLGVMVLMKKRYSKKR